jgi:hypothetical protein
MKRTITARRDGRDDRKRLDAAADARHAAQVAAMIARASEAWSRRYATGEDDAAEATQAAIRARLAAERAEHASNHEDAVAAARLAWAAVMSAGEADGRVVAAVVEAIAAARRPAAAA